jgi:ADP-heptose:LPS heptosyltransferase
VPRIAYGFRSGIGNFIIATSVIQTLADYAGQPVDLILDDDWRDGGREAVELIASQLPFIKNIVEYPCDLREWDYVYMSRHGYLISSLYQELFGNMALKIADLPGWAKTYQHERDFYLQEISELLSSGTRLKIFPQIMPVAEKFPYELPEGPIICLANGWKRSHGNKWGRKAYPHFPEYLGSLLGFYPEVHVCLLGGKEDQKWAQSLGKNPRVHDFTGKLNILETAYLVKKAALTVSSDSAVGHLIDALNRPGIVLFGSTLVSKNSPLNQSVEVIRSPLVCAPCQGTVYFSLCQNSSECMAAIEPGLVMAYVRKLLR